LSSLFDRAAALHGWAAASAAVSGGGLFRWPTTITGLSAAVSCAWGAVASVAAAPAGVAAGFCGCGCCGFVGCCRAWSWSAAWPSSASWALRVSADRCLAAARLASCRHWTDASLTPAGSPACARTICQPASLSQPALSRVKDPNEATTRLGFSWPVTAHVRGARARFTPGASLPAGERARPAGRRRIADSACSQQLVEHALYPTSPRSSLCCGANG